MIQILELFGGIVAGKNTMRVCGFDREEKTYEVSNRDPKRI